MPTTQSSSSTTIEPESPARANGCDPPALVTNQPTEIVAHDGRATDLRQLDAQRFWRWVQQPLSETRRVDAALVDDDRLALIVDVPRPPRDRVLANNIRQAHTVRHPDDAGVELNLVGRLGWMTCDDVADMRVA